MFYLITSKRNIPGFLVFALAIQAAAAITLLLDIPFARQVSIFLFIAFIPGLLIMKILRYERQCLAETILFSVGLSLAYLMIIGFLTNELGSLILISQPLSVQTLFIIINSTISVMYILAYYRNKEGLNFRNSLRPGPLLFLVLPVLSAIGVSLMTAFSSNLLLILLYILIAIIFVVALFSSRLSPHYPLIIFVIGLALLLSTALSFRYVYGADLALEYGVFRETQNHLSLNWAPSSFEQIAAKSMLSVTILPTIFSNLMNIEGTFVFKIVFSIIFSLVPVGLYQLYTSYWGKKTSFASVFFFMATFGFYSSMIAQGKQIIAELFYVLLFLIIFTKGSNYKSNDWIIIIFLVFGLVVSHYSISYIFIFLTMVTILCLKIISKNKNFKIKATLVAFSLCLTFLWYTTLVYGPFEKFVSMIRYTVDNFLDEFFYLGARGETVQLAIGAIESQTFLHGLATYVHNITTLLILVGFISLLWKWRKDKLNSEYFMLITLNMGLLFSAIIIPRFAGFLEMWRLHHIALIFVAPLFVLGSKALVTFFLRLKNRKIVTSNQEKKTYSLILVSVILVPFFLFQNGLIYEIGGDPIPSSIALSKNQMWGHPEIIEESDVFSASWLSKFGDITNMFTYSDTTAVLYVLQSYSGIDRRMLLLLSNTTQKISYYDTWSLDPSFTFSNNSYIYLRHYNTVEEKTVWNVGRNIQYNFTEIPILNNTDAFISKIYTNSASEVYYHVPLE